MKKEAQAIEAEMKSPILYINKPNVLFDESIY
jgi:hypothetical protein